MPIYLPTNQYAGVNAHLHSVFQQAGGWESLHLKLISRLADELALHLPAGYFVDVEQSLQIREIHPDSGEQVRRTRPDLTIYRREPAPPPPPVLQPGTLATLAQPLMATLVFAPDWYLQALVIRRATPDTLLGDAITRIEVLSPTNKPGGAGTMQYQTKRFEALQSGVALVEIDLLHETPPVIGGLPRYPDESDSHPYHIHVSQPYPTLEQGTTHTYAFDVDVALPLVAVPLGSQGGLTIAFDPLYQQLYAATPAYHQVRVDYAAPPPRLATYSAADQARIAAVMRRAAEAV